MAHIGNVLAVPSAAPAETRVMRLRNFWSDYRLSLIHI